MKKQLLYRLNSFRQQCPISKPGANYGEATMFQEEWVHGKTGACGFERPSSSHGDDDDDDVL